MATNLLNSLMEKPKDSHMIKEMITKIESGYLVDRGTKYRKKKSFSPSTLVYGNGACPRYWYYAFTGADFTDDADAYSVANMTSGTHSHERLQKAMKASGILVEDEVTIINDDPPMYGFADGILEWEGEYLVAEIKTMRDESFQYRKNSTPPTYHVEQLLFYMKVLKMAKGVLIYESKNTHQLHIIVVEVSQENIDWVDNSFEWMREVYKSWQNGTLPEKPYRSNSKICKRCPVKDTCFADSKGDVEIKPMEHLK